MREITGDESRSQACLCFSGRTPWPLAPRTLSGSCLALRQTPPGIAKGSAAEPSPKKIKNFLMPKGAPCSKLENPKSTRRRNTAYNSIPGRKTLYYYGGINFQTSFSLPPIFSLDKIYLILYPLLSDSLPWPLLTAML